MKYAHKLAFLLVLVYGLFYLSYFWQTPLGQTPVLDGSENISLAQQIANGTLSKEPFYRSMLYPAYLSIFCHLGFNSISELFWIASLSGMIFHFVCSILLYNLSQALWGDKKAAILCLLIYGFYTPAVFFAAEPFDMTISIAFMLGSVLVYICAINNKKSLVFLLSGILLGISALFRSNVLPVAIIFVVYPFFNHSLIKKSLLSIAGLGLIMLAGGFACYYQSGEFRLLPWQGASNLYSANNRKANGKFFKHSIFLPDREAGTNPTRLESEIIYSRETGKQKPFDIDDFNRFWTQKTINEIKEAPLEWLTLIFHKYYFLFNNYEQYNNKTFSFHKQISPPLMYNPLCYGILVILLFLSLANLNDIYDKSKIYTVFAGIIFLSFGIIGFYVSARFRLLITPLMAAIGSGFFRLDYIEMKSRKNFFIASFCIAVTFSALFNVNDTSTYREDRLLNAFACSRLGYDEDQFLWADRVLSEDPENIQAIRLKLVAFTNLVFFGKFSRQDDWQYVSRELKYLNSKGLSFSDTSLLSGCYATNFENNLEKAYNLWLNGGAESPQPYLYMACLIYADICNPTKQDIAIAPKIPILAAAIEENRSVKFENVNREEVEKSKKVLAFLIKTDYKQK